MILMQRTGVSFSLRSQSIAGRKTPFSDFFYGKILKMIICKVNGMDLDLFPNRQLLPHTGCACLVNRAIYAFHRYLEENIMIMMSVQQVSKMYGGNPVLENINFEVNEEEKVALIGRNGCGKTTLLKIISGEESADEGTVHYKKGSKIGYLAQIPSVSDEVKAINVLETAFGDLKSMEKQMKKMESNMSDSGSEDPVMERLLIEYGKIQESYTQLGGYEMDAKLSKVVHGLRLEALVEQSFSSLSGGEQTKIGLGLLLLKEPDLLLLDEPTNHLDIEAVEWLEGFLKEYKGTVIVVSHDRYFLDEVIQKVIDMDDGEMDIYQTNYSDFLKEREEKLMLEFHHYKEQQKKIKKMKETIRRLRQWANEASPPNEKFYRKAKSMEKALERMEKLKRPILERKKMGLQFEMGTRSGKDVIECKGVSKSFGERVLFENVQFLIQYQDRVAIVGANGTGKSTLLQMVLNNEENDADNLRVGSNVKIGYLSQLMVFPEPHKKVIDVFRDEVQVPEGDARHLLARFLFYGAAVFREVGQLSGGERMRLRLAQLMHQEVNLFVLDEPTNHLDIESREVLEEALEDFAGTILAVSHDRYFLNKLFDRTFWIEDKHLQIWEGNYNLAKRKRNERQEKQPVVMEKIVTKKKTRQPLSNSKEDRIKTVQKIEKEIEELEKRVQELDLLMSNETNVEEVQNWYGKKKEIESIRDAKYEEWEKTTEQSS
jgi:ATP-binding cassette subfamily F protein 3